jgi:hypothetical protein
VVAPRLLRRRVGSRRESAAATGGGRGAEAAWDEVRATAIDLGHRWDDQATLHGQREALLGLLHRAPLGTRAAGAPTPASADVVRAAVDRLVHTVERARFSPVPLTEQAGREAWTSAQVVLRALWDRTEPRERRRATWWPRSLRVAGASAQTSAVGMRESAEEQARAALEDNVRV